MAPQNRDIKMRIFLDAAGAEKAYNALMRNIEAGQKRIAELKNAKKTNGRLTDSEAEELKNLQQDQKVWKSIVKETRGYYSDIASSIQNINALQIRELEGLIKNTKDQLRSLIPGKDDADISRLSQALGVAQRELAARNQQILHQSQRSFQAIITEINTSQEHLAAISTKGANAAAMRQQQEEMQKNLTRLETRRRNEEEKFAQHQAEIASRQAAYNAAIVGQKQEIIRAIQDQVNAEVNLQQFLAKKPRSAAAIASHDADKELKEKTVARTQQRMAAVLSANAAEADSIQVLIQMYKDLVNAQVRPVRKPNGDKWDASIAAQKEKVTKATEAAIAAEKEYNEARSKAGTDKPYQQSIDILKRLRNELEAVRNKETEVAERMKMTDQLKEMDRIIQEMEGKRMSMRQARQFASSPYTAQIEQLKQARQAWEEYRLTLNAGDVKGLQEVDQALKTIDNTLLRSRENAINWQQTIRQARKAMGDSKNAVNGTSLEALRQQYERLKQARDLVTQEPARNTMNEQLRQMEQRMQEMQTQMMSGRQVSQVYSQAIAEIGKGTAANSAKLRENIELMKVAQMSKDIDAQTYNRLSAAIKVSTDMLNKEGNSYMTTSQALRAYRQGSQLLAQGENASVDAIRQVVTAMNDAQHIEGISVKQKAIYASMVSRLTELLNTEHKQTISLTDADKIYSNGINNTVGTLKAAIAAYKALADAEGTSAEKAAEYNTKARELNDILTKQRSTMSSAQAFNIAHTGNGTIAQLTEAKKVLEEWKQGLQTTDITGLVRVNNALREIDARMKAINATPAMTKDMAEGIATGRLTVTIERTIEAKKVLEEYKASLNTSNTRAIDDVNEKLLKLDEIIKRVNGDNFMKVDMAKGLANGTITGTVEQLREAEKSLVHFRDTMLQTTDTSQLAAFRDMIASVKEKIDQATKSASAMGVADAQGIARGTLPATVADLTTAKSALEEYKRSLATTDDTKLKEVNADLKLIEEQMKVVNGTNRMVIQSTTQYNQMIADAMAVLRQGYAASGAEISTQLDLMKQLANAENISGAQKAEVVGITNMLTEAEKGNARAIFDEVSAQRQYAQAQDMLRNTSSYTTDELRRQHQIMQQATTARGLSLQTTQQCVAAEREFAEILKQSNTSTMTAAEAEIKIAEAKVMLENIYLEETSAIKTMVEQLKLAENAEGMLLNRSQEAVGIRKQMEQALNRSTGATMSYTQAQGVLAKGDAALVSEINAAIASLEAENNVWNTSAETKKRNLTLMEQLRALTSVTRKEATALAYDEKAVKFALDNIKTVPVDKLREAIQMLRHEIEHVEKDQQKFIQKSSELNKLEAHYKSIKGSVDGVAKSLQNQGTWFEKASTKLLNYLGIFGGFFLVRQKMQQWFKSNMQFDDSMSNIRKTTQMTSEQVVQLAEDIKHIDTRTSITALNDLAYAAGRLGVKGVTDVMGFVRAADQINIALGEQLKGAESVEQLMKITELTGANAEYGLEEALTRTGSAINVLTMNSQATAQPMVDMMRRVASVGVQAGLTTSEIVGLSGAVNALGQPVEMSATSISKMLVQMEKNSLKVAKALKMTQEETQKFRYDLGAGRAAEAFMTVLQKTNEAGGLSHLGTIVKDLGSEGQRVIQTIATLSQNYELVGNMIKMSNQAFEEGTSVINEYNLKNENAAALWEKLKNQFSKLFITPEAVQYIRDFVKELFVLPDVVKQIMDSLAPVAKFFASTVLVILTDCTSLLSGLIQAAAWRMILVGIVNITNAALTGVVALRRFGLAAIAAFLHPISTLKTLWATIKLATVSAHGLHLSFVKLFTYLKSASFGNIFTAVLTVILGIVEAVRMWGSEQEKFMRNTEEEIGHINAQARATTAQINDMLRKYKEVQDNEFQRKQLIDQMNKSYGDYLDNLLTEKSTYEDIVRSLKAANAQLRLKALNEGMQKARNDIYNDHSEERKKANNLLVESVLDVITTRSIGEDKKVYEQRRADNEGVASTIVLQLIEGMDKLLKSDGDVLNTQTEKFRQITEPLLKSIFSDQGINLSSRTIETAYNKIAESLKGVSDVEKVVNNEIAKSDRLYNRDRAQAADTIVENTTDADGRRRTTTMLESYRKDTDEALKAVRSAITQNGTLVFGGFDENGRYKGIANEEQQNRWVDRVNKMDSKARVQELKDLDRAIENLGNLMEALDAKRQNGDAKAEREYREAFVLKANAEILRKVDRNPIEDASTKDKDGKTRRDAKSEYDDIIKKIEAFFKTRAEQISFDRENGKMTQYEFERQTKENEKFLNDALAIARDGISRDNDALNDFVKAWEDEKKLLESLIRSGQTEHDARYYMDLINNTGPLRNIGIAAVKGENDAGNDGTAWLHGVMSQAESNRLNSLKIQNEWNNQMLKAQLEHSPVGKITEQYLVEFQQLGLMFERLEAENSDELRRKEQEVMASYLKIGKETSKYDITTREGLDKFRAFVGSQHEIVNDANAVTDEMLRSFYYQSYQYAEQYGEAVSKLIEKNRKAWERMFKQSARYTSLQDAETEARNALKSSASQVQGRRGMFGVFGKRTSLEDERQAAQQNLDRLIALDAQSEGFEYESLVDKAQKRLERINKKIQKATESYENAIEEIKELEEMGEKEYNSQHARDGLTYNLRMAQLRKTVAAAERKLRNDTVKTQLTLGAQQMERYGGSNRYTLQKQVDQKRAELNTRVGVWDNDIAKAEAMQRAQQYNYNAVAQEYGADSDEARKAFGDLEQANAQLEAMQQMPDEVRTAIEGLTDAMVNLQDATYAWAGEMVSAFEKVADAFVPLRSWYDDKGSFAQNVFGTKAERQKAFGDFMDDMKKTTRKAVQEQARLATQQFVMKQIEARKEKVLKMKQMLEDQQIDTEGLTHKQIVEQAKVTMVQVGEKQMSVANAVGVEERKRKNTEEATTVMWGNFGKAITAAWADGGPFLGAVLAAGVSAALGAVMTMVFNMLGSSSKASTSAPKTKLVSGMLTYDNGNVQSVFNGGVGEVRTYDRGRQPVMGDDGKLYWVEDRDYGVSPKTGLLTRPTLTSIGGQPALVAENGPEMVIGRATTHALALNEPEVLRTIIRYDQNHSRGFAKTFDAGTAGSLAAGTPSSSGSSAFDAEVSSAQSAALADTLTALSQTLAAIQQQGIPANLNMYGAGGALEKFAEAMYKTQRRGTDPNLNRLFRR